MIDKPEEPGIRSFARRTSNKEKNEQKKKQMANFFTHRALSLGILMDLLHRFNSTFGGRIDILSFYS